MVVEDRLQALEEALRPLRPSAARASAAASDVGRAGDATTRTTNQADPVAAACQAAVADRRARHCTGRNCSPRRWAASIAATTHGCVAARPPWRSANSTSTRRSWTGISSRTARSRCPARRCRAAASAGHAAGGRLGGRHVGRGRHRRRGPADRRRCSHRPTSRLYGSGRSFAAGRDLEPTHAGAVCAGVGSGCLSLARPLPRIWTKPVDGS